MSNGISESMMSTIDEMSTVDLCNMLGIDTNTLHTLTRNDVISIGTDKMIESYAANSENASYDEHAKWLYMAHTLCEEQHLNLPKESKFVLADW